MNILDKITSLFKKTIDPFYLIEKGGLWFESKYSLKISDYVLSDKPFTGRVEHNVTKFFCGIVNNGKKQGIWLEYYLSNNPKIRTRSIYNYNGKLEGERLVYYENGQLKIKEYYIDGKKEGEELSYYESGKLEIKEYYIDSKREGEFFYYYESGKLGQKGNYKDGKFDGENLSYYESGQLKIKGNYKDGKLEGEELWYDESGKLEKTIIFKEGSYITKTIKP